MRGLKRSGNHVLSTWLTASLNACFQNNVIPIGAILQGEREYPQAIRWSEWLYKHWQKQNFRCRKPFSHLLSLEDIPLEISPVSRTPVKHLFVFRDPINTFASRLRKGLRTEMPAYPTEWGKLMSSQVEMWKSYGQHALEPNGFRNIEAVIFDRFISSEAYRKEIAARFGLKYRPPLLSQITAHGGGSSFAGRGRAGAGFVPAVKSRWEFLTKKEREVLDPLVHDDELSDIWARLQRMY